MKFKKELLDYRGLKLQVPEEATCIFTESNGTIVFSRHKPEILGDKWFHVLDHILMTIVTKDNTGWQDSLVSLEPEYQ